MPMYDHINVLFVISQQLGMTFAIQEQVQVLENHTRDDLECHFDLRC